MFGIEKLKLVEILYSDNNLKVGIKSRGNSAPIISNRASKSASFPELDTNTDYE
jgi:hypothetical protein